MGWVLLGGLLFHEHLVSYGDGVRPYIGWLVLVLLHLLLGQPVLVPGVLYVLPDSS